MYGGENGTASSKRVDLGQSEYDDSLNSIYNQTESNIKIELESWYKTNILDKGLDIFVSDEIFCNDRSTPGKEISNWSYDTGLGYGPKQTAYGARARLIDGKTTNSKGDTTNPQFICPNKNDAFTKADIKVGNGKLNQKVGLITADEINTAGGISSVDNNSYYLYKGSAYWSSSPMNYYSSNASMMYVTASGSIHFLYVNKTSGVAPVINLTPEYVLQMVGDGTIGNEYRVE